MKPDWDKLIGEFASSDTKLVADVDCTAEGKPLCDANGVQGFPTLKWGDPSDLQAYEGGRTYDDLKKFAEENLKPLCSVSNIDLCDDDMKANIKKYQDMSADDLAALVEVEETKLSDAEAFFKAEVEKLQATYQQLSKDKDDAQAAVKESGLGLMKSVFKSKTDSSKDEL